MAFDNTSPLSYASGEVVKYINAQRGLSDPTGGPALTVTGFYNPSTGDLYDPSSSSNTANQVRISANTTNQQILGPNSARKGLIITNEQAGNNSILVRFGGVANSTAYSFPLYSGGVYETGVTVRWTGNVNVICLSGTCNVNISEFI